MDKKIHDITGAALVTEHNASLIEALNDGTPPSKKQLDTPTYFIHRGNGIGNPFDRMFVTKEVFERDYVVIEDSGPMMIIDEKQPV